VFAKDSPINNLPAATLKKYETLFDPEKQSSNWKIPNSAAIFYTNLQYTDHFWLDRQNRLMNANLPLEKRINTLPETPDGFHTIEHTAGGRALIDAILSEKPPLSREIRNALWNEASKRYASEAEGDVIALVYEGNTKSRYSYETNDPKNKKIEIVKIHCSKS
jgi:hypothetical protein